MNQEKMNDCQREKDAFVACELAALLNAATEGDVVAADYAVEGAGEFVHVIYANGHRKRACVTGDSLKAVAEDVLAVI